MLTASQFQKAAEQRFTVAEFLLEENDYRLDAFYLGGYAVECILKALIMHLTPEAGQNEAFATLTSGAKMHYPENLNEELKKLGQPIPPGLIRRLRRFDWSTSLRYESRRVRYSEVHGYLCSCRLDQVGEERDVMSTQIREWERMRTDESRMVEQLLSQHFESVDAYRYNSASLRIRVVDSRFKGLGRESRDDLVEPHVADLNQTTQADIMNLVLLFPGEVEESIRARLMNEEFEHPSRSML